MTVAYFKSALFKRLGPTTQHARRLVIETMCTEPIHPGAQETFADFPLPRMSTKSLRILRDRKVDRPEAANQRVKVLRTMFRWATSEELVQSNPARDLERLENASEGHHSWTIEEIRQFEARHPVGTKARLALCLLMWTGVRRSDAVRLGRQHARNGIFTFTPVKNARRKPVRAEIPILPELQRVIDSSPSWLPTTDARLRRLGSGTSFGNGATKPICRTARRMGCARLAPRPQRKTARRASS